VADDNKGMIDGIGKLSGRIQEWKANLEGAVGGSAGFSLSEPPSKDQAGNDLLQKNTIPSSWGREGPISKI